MAIFPIVYTGYQAIYLFLIVGSALLYAFVFIRKHFLSHSRTGMSYNLRQA